MLDCIVLNVVLNGPMVNADVTIIKGGPTMKTCIICHTTAKYMEYDEFLDGYVCKVCDTKREIGVLKR